MKERLTSNIGLKIISLVFAFLLWIAIMNTEDPVATKQYANVPVTATNESLITNDGKIYQVLSDSNVVTVSVTAKRSVLRGINSSDIVAEADIANLQLNTLVPITVKIPDYEGRYEEAKASPSNMKISIEDNESIKLPITVDTTGTTRDGYFVESTSVSPDNVTVSGPKSIIDSIESAVVAVNVSGLSASGSVSGTLTFYNAQGKAVDASLLSQNIGDAGITVYISVLRTKSVPITVGTSGEPAEGYFMDSITCEPETVELTGKEEYLNGVSEIVIPSELINISNATANIETVVNIKDYLPNGLSLADDKSNKILITAVIESYGTKTISYPVGSIQVLNAPDGFKMTYSGTDNLSIKFQGPEAALALLSSSSIQAVIDLKSVTEAGTYDETVTITAPDGCMLTNSVKVTVVLTKK